MGDGEPVGVPADDEPIEVPDDEELRLEIKRTLIAVMRSATKPKWVSHECEFMPDKGNGPGKRRHHKIELRVDDYSNIVKAAGELLDRLEGKAATRRDAPKPKLAGRSLDELSDAELEAIIAADDGFMGPGGPEILEDVDAD